MSDTEKIYKALKAHFGFDTFKGSQLEIIQNLLDGNDVFVFHAHRWRQVVVLSVARFDVGRHCHSGVAADCLDEESG